jgi:hypothetical protein
LINIQAQQLLAANKKAVNEENINAIETLLRCSDKAWNGSCSCSSSICVHQRFSTSTYQHSIGSEHRSEPIGSNGTDSDDSDEDSEDDGEDDEDDEDDNEELLFMASMLPDEED